MAATMPARGAERTEATTTPRAGAVRRPSGSGPGGAAATPRSWSRVVRARVVLAAGSAATTWDEPQESKPSFTGRAPIEPTSASCTYDGFHVGTERWVS